MYVDSYHVTVKLCTLTTSFVIIIRVYGNWNHGIVAQEMKRSTSNVRGRNRNKRWCTVQSSGSEQVIGYDRMVGWCTKKSRKNNRMFPNIGNAHRGPSGRTGLRCSCIVTPNQTEERTKHDHVQSGNHQRHLDYPRACRPDLHPFEPLVKGQTYPALTTSPTGKPTLSSLCTRRAGHV